MRKNTNLPEYLNVLGVRFRIEVVDMIDEDGSAGETKGELRLIRILEAQDTRRKWTTLMHEWVHAVLHVIGIGNTADPALEEVVAQSMEHALEEVLKQIGPQLLNALSVEKE